MTSDYRIRISIHKTDKATNKRMFLFPMIGSGWWRLVSVGNAVYRAVQYCYLDMRKTTEDGIKQTG